VGALPAAGSCPGPGNGPGRVACVACTWDAPFVKVSSRPGVGLALLSRLPAILLIRVPILLIGFFRRCWRKTPFFRILLILLILCAYPPLENTGVNLEPGGWLPSWSLSRLLDHRTEVTVLN